MTDLIKAVHDYPWSFILLVAGLSWLMSVLRDAIAVALKAMIIAIKAVIKSE